MESKKRNSGEDGTSYVEELGDSGAIDLDSAPLSDRDEDEEDYVEDEDKDEDVAVKSITTTTLDSGVDVGLSQTFDSLNVRNDLGTDAEPRITNLEDHHHHQQQEVEQPWEIYYRQDDDGNTQLHIAIIHGLMDAILALLHMCPHPALLDIRNDSGHAPIHLAVLTRQAHVARRLLIAGAKVNTRDANGNTALHLASCTGDLSCLRALTIPLVPQPPSHSTLHQQLLLQQSRPRSLPQALNQKNYDGETCVHLAAIAGHIEVLRHLVWFGADINATENKGGRTALHLAIERDNIELIKYLVPIMACHIRTYSGHTALQLGTYELKKQLLAAGYKRQEDESDLESDFDSEEDDDEDNIIQYTNPNTSHFNSGMRSGEAINVA